MDFKRWTVLIVAIVALAGLAGCAPLPANVQPSVAEQPADALAITATPELTANTQTMQSATDAQYQPPQPLEGDLSEQELRTELIETKQGMCQDLELIAGVILNTGILSKVPARIQDMTDMQINELESMETQACLEQDVENMSTTDLLNNVRNIKWLVKVHLVAMDDVTLQDPTFRPINAEGSFASFFKLHDTIVKGMRNHLAALSDDPTLEEAQQLSTFWQDVLQPHAQAEEAACYPIVHKAGDEALRHSSDLVESEHDRIDQQIAKYMETLEAVENGEADVKELVPIARDIRSRTELHFGKEEESVIRVLQDKISSAQYLPAVEQQDARIGSWLRDHGWEGLPKSSN